MDLFFELFSRRALKRTLFGTFSILLAIVFSVSWFFTARSLKKFSDASIQDLAERSSSLVFEKFSAYLDTNVALLEANSVVFENFSALPLSDFLDLFEKELRSFPGIHIVSAGFEDGEYVEAQRMNDGTIRLGRAGRDSGGDLVWYVSRKDGTLEEVDRRRNYDPRTRPWYQNTVFTGAMNISSPYSIVSTGNKVIAVSLPLSTDQGAIRGVITVDVLLDDLQGTIATLADQFLGYVLIRDLSGAIIASDTRGGSGIFSLPPEPTKTAGSIHVEGQPFRFITLQYQKTEQFSLLITVALPEVAFRTSLFQNLVNLSVIYLIALALFSLLVYGIAAAVGRPIEQFTNLLRRLSLETQHSFAISNEEKAQVNSIALRKTELGSMAKCFHSLLEKLQETMASLTQSLTDKDVLLKEVHHRVKNNLQVIASLIHLQAEEQEDKSIQSVFYELEEKVYAMSMVHETVYASEAFSAVPMSTYLKRLAESLESYHSLLIPISITVDADDIRLPLDRAIPCALILVELVTNAFKYAFADKTEGQIRIVMTQQEDAYVLMVQDNGGGFAPEDAERIKDGSGTGSIIMQALTGQLRGSMHLETGPDGTTVAIRFPRL